MMCVVYPAPAADAVARGDTGRGQVMGRGGTLGGGDMGQHSMGVGPVQHTHLDPARGT